MSTFHLPDVSEFQPDVTWSGVVNENGGAAVIRAMYGQDYVDALYAQGRRAAARAAGVRALGIYQYVRQDQDVTAQAQAFVTLLGGLEPGEFAVMDLEEGSGDQSGRADTWLAVVNAGLSYSGYNGAWLYSGLEFALNQGLAPIFNGSAVHTWVAAYQASEPTLGHSLWQHSNGTLNLCTFEPWQGAGFVDCSSRDGELTDLLNLIYTSGAPEDDEDDMGELSVGTNAQDVIVLTGGSKSGITFGCDASFLGMNAPYLRIAFYDDSANSWTVSRQQLPVSGRLVCGFGTGNNVGMVTTVRNSGGAADNVPVGYHLYD